MVRVVVENVVKYYENPETISGEREPALRGVSLEVEDGETLSVVGPSGCGKSTLLKVVAGLETPDEGRVFYNELDVTHEKPQNRGVGMIFQDYALYPTQEGKGNLKYYFEVHRHTQEETEARTRETAELMGVDFNYLLGRMPATLSGGEQQRVAIARCIVRDPLLFLMDEPISNLDAKLRERTRLEIKKLLRRFGITTLYVTHDQQEAIFMGDRIAVMRNGIVEQIGAFDDLYYSPANLFVATFIGAPPLSVLPVQIEDGQVVMEQARWQLPTWLATQIPAGPAQLGVRPEAWEIDAADGVAVVVRNIERIPTEQAAFIRGQMAGQMLSILAPLDQMEEKEVRVTPVWDSAYFFVADGEEIIHAPDIQELF